ncbi:MAG: zinc-dependent metalloprotease [Planctomycetes bacterium]|nr:zinc-dependent metalloprotease [Planctomycetota bacterium]
MKRFITLTCMAIVLSAGVAHAAETELEKDRKRFGDWKKTLKDWRNQDGFLNLWRPTKASTEKGQRILASIDKAQLGKPFFLATSISGGSDYAGWQWEDKLVRLERFDKQLLLIELNTQQRAEKGKPIAEVVSRTYEDRLISSFPITAIGKKGELLFDLGQLLAGNYSTFFGGFFSLRSSLAQFVKVKAFPKNVEVGIRMPLYGDGTFMTLHYSISELPALKDYTARDADDRVGYFLTAVRDYSKGKPQDGRMVRMINRWKLEKADASLKLSPPKEPIVFYIERTVPIAYRQAVAAGILEWNKAFEQIGIRGAIVVRQQTDTQFSDIDPEDVRYNFFRWITSESAFAMGPSRVDPRNGRILDADIIFDDSMLRGYMTDYDVLLRDAPKKQLTRASAQLLEDHPRLHPLAHKRTRKPDPRLQSLKQALREVLRPNDKATRTIKTADQLNEFVRQRGRLCQVGSYMPQQVGLLRLALSNAATGKGGFSPYIDQIVKETVMHEVGHTLGLRHNFQASSWLTFEQINAKDRPGAISASVMDYHPVNLAGPDLAQGNFLATTIGPYDMIAIEYGYSLSKEGSKELKAIPRKIAAQGLPYATDEDVGSPDASIARWDLGKNPIAFANARTKLVQKLWKDLEKRVVSDDQGYSRLRRALNILLFEVQTSALSVSRQIGGLEFHRDHKGDPNARPPISVTPAADQRAALKWLAEHILEGKALRVPPELEEKLAAGRWVHWGTRDGSATLDYSVMDRVVGIQSWILFALTADDVLARVWENEARQARVRGAKPLTVVELFDTIERAVFKDFEKPIGAASAVNPYVARQRQALQDAYVRRLIALSLGNGTAPAVANKMATQRLLQLEGNFAAVLAGAKGKLDPYTRAHLEVLRARAKKVRNPEYVHLASGGDALCSLSRPDTQDHSAWLLLGLVVVVLGTIRVLPRG